MPEVIFTGPAGRIEGRYQPAKQKGAPIAIVLHPHPQFGGTMNNQIVYNLFYNFVNRGFSVLRFNFRGVGRSQGSFDHGQGELSDAAAALDWAQSVNADARACWIAGVSFGAWIGMQLLMRRPEIEGFISIAAMANRYDFSFLAPCPSSGLFVHGSEDRVAPVSDVISVIEKVKTQKGVKIEHATVEGANHFFDGKVDELMESVDEYLTKRLGKAEAGGLRDGPSALSRRECGETVTRPGEAATGRFRTHRPPDERRDERAAIRIPEHPHRARLHPSGLRCRGHRRGRRGGPPDHLCRLRLHRPVPAYRASPHDHDAALAPAHRRRPADRAHGRRHDPRRRSVRQGREPQILSVEDIEANKDSIRTCFSRFITFGAGEHDAIMADNAEWLTKLNYIDFLRDVGRHFSVNRMLSFDSVKLRLDRDQELSFLEFNYMILQAYDFVELNRRYGCILQMGGSDQWGNIVNGIDLGRRHRDAAALSP